MSPATYYAEVRPVFDVPLSQNRRNARCHVTPSVEEILPMADCHAVPIALRCCHDPCSRLQGLLLTSRHLGAETMTGVFHRTRW